MTSLNSEEIDEQLTAYLDGELSNEERVDLESKLVSDASLRLRLAELRKAYDLLDDLPETPYNQRFTQSTLELVVSDLKATLNSSNTSTSADAPTTTLHWNRKPLWLVLFAIGGLVLGLSLGSIANRRDLQELSLIANLPALQEFSDIQQLKELTKDAELLELVRERMSGRLIDPIPKSMADRSRWLLSLSPLQSAKMEANRERLSKLDPAIARQLSKAQSTIDTDPDSVKVFEVLQVIQSLLDGLPNWKRQDFDSLSKERRFDFLREQFRLSAAMQYAKQLTAEDSKALEEWAEHEFVPAIYAEFDRLPPNRSVEDLINLLWSRRRVEDGFQIHEQQRLIDSLSAKLSGLASRILLGVNRNEQLAVLTEWLVPHRSSSVERLVESYDRIGRDRRDAIDIESPDLSKRVLEDTARRMPATSRSRNTNETNTKRDR